MQHNTCVIWTTSINFGIPSGLVLNDLLLILIIERIQFLVQLVVLDFFLVNIFLPHLFM